MPDTGLLSPSANGDGYTEWTNPANGYASDDADTYPYNPAEQHDWYNFDFSIPSGATIDGIEVLLEGGKVGSSGTSTVDIELSYNGGAGYTTSGYSVTFPTIADTTETAGGSSDTWGRSWSVGEFTNANFRVRLTGAGNAGMFVDHIQVRVTYTEEAVTRVITSGVSIPGLL